MSVGTVKWFNTTKGFGFIAPDGGGEDLFVHQSEIQAQGYRELLEGQRVEFEVTQGKKGMQASSVPRSEVPTPAAARLRACTAAKGARRGQQVATEGLG